MVIRTRLKFKDSTTITGITGSTMPHDHITLAQAPNGEIGPRCKACGMRLTFGNAMAVGKHFMCWEHYVEATGAETATSIGEAEERFWMTNE
ncbi:MAG TPA: hypothetical protein HA268_03145 [Candidatus Poseidoniaceae archaeon]|nr:hypothetical protein [Candidatus Poseidoniaceae archaeon]